MPHRWLTVCYIAILPTVAAASASDSEVEALRAQLRSTVLQLRQLQDQQAAPPAAVVVPPADMASKAKMTALQAELRTARQSAAQADMLQSEIKTLRSQNASLSKTGAEANAELETLKASNSKGTVVGRALAAENTTLKERLETVTRVASACQAKNTRLISFAEGLLASDRKIGFGLRLAAREPFVGFERVRLENLAQDREDQVRTDRCDERLDATPPSALPAVEVSKTPSSQSSPK